MLRVLGLILAMSYALVTMGQDWDEDYIYKLFAQRIIDPIEGIWQFPSGGPSILIVRQTESTYSIHILDSPSLDLKPGVIIGEAVTTPKEKYYDGRLDSKLLGRHNKFGKQTVTFTVNNNGTITINPYKTGYSVSFARWFYRMFKLNLIDNESHRPKDLIGAYRIYPFVISDHFPICL